jgi:hypothetical protein
MLASGVRPRCIDIAEGRLRVIDGSELLLRKIDHRALFRRSHFPAVIRVVASRCCDRWCGSGGGDAATFTAGDHDCALQSGVRCSAYT